jgi:hypothetical protein
MKGDYRNLNDCPISLLPKQDFDLSKGDKLLVKIFWKEKYFLRRRGVRVWCPLPHYL